MYITCRYVINDEFDGSIARFGSEVVLRQGLSGLVKRWPPLWSAKTLEAWQWFLTFGSIQALMQLYVPGKAFRGPVSPKGNVPVYKVCSLACGNKRVLGLPQSHDGDTCYASRCSEQC